VLRAAVLTVAIINPVQNVASSFLSFTFLLLFNPLQLLSRPNTEVACPGTGAGAVVGAGAGANAGAGGAGGETGSLATPLSHGTFGTPVSKAKTWQDDDGHYTAVGTRVVAKPAHLVIGVKFRYKSEDYFLDEWLPGSFDRGIHENNTVKLLDVKFKAGSPQLPTAKTAEHAFFEHFKDPDDDGPCCLRANPFPITTVASLYEGNQPIVGIVGSHKAAEDKYHYHMEGGQTAKSVKKSYRYVYRSDYSGERGSDNRCDQNGNCWFVDLSSAAQISLEVADFEPVKDEGSDSFAYKGIRKNITIDTDAQDEKDLFIGATYDGRMVQRWYLNLFKEKLIRRFFELDETGNEISTKFEAEEKDLANPQLDGTLYIGMVKEVCQDSPLQFLDFVVPTDLTKDGPLTDAQQICGDTDASEAVWNGVITRLSFERETKPESPNIFHWIITIYGRYGTNVIDFYEERTVTLSDDELCVDRKWALANVDESMDAIANYTDTLWKLVPRVPVFGNNEDTHAAGKQANATNKKMWQNLRMRQYRIITSLPNAKATEEPNTDYIDYAFSTLKQSLNVEAGQSSRCMAYSIVDKNGKMYEFDSKKAYEEAKDVAKRRPIAPIRLEDGVYPSGPNGRCHVTFFDVPVDNGGGGSGGGADGPTRTTIAGTRPRPCLTVHPNPLVSPMAKVDGWILPAVNEVVKDIVQQCKDCTTVNNAFKQAEMAVYRKLDEYWMQFTLQTEIETADAAYAQNSSMCYHLKLFFDGVFAACEKLPTKLEQDIAKHAMLSAREIALMHPSHSDIKAMGKGSMKFNGDVRFDDYSTGSFWSWKNDDAFVHFLDNPDKLLDALAGLESRELFFQHNSDGESDWRSRVLHQAQSHLTYIMRRKYVNDPGLMLKDDAGDHSIEEYVGALVADPQTGIILSVDEDNSVCYYIANEKIKDELGREFSENTPLFASGCGEDCTYRIQDEKREFKKLHKDFNLSNLKMKKWKKGGNSFTFVRSPTLIDDHDHIIAERKDSIIGALTEIGSWQSGSGTTVKDYAGVSVYGASEWAGHCDIKASMESFGITPLPNIDRVVFEIEMEIINAHFLKVEQLAKAGKEVWLILPDDAAKQNEAHVTQLKGMVATCNTECKKDYLTGGSVEIKQKVTGKTMETHLKSKLHPSIYCASVSKIQAGRKGVVDAQIKRNGRVAIQQTKADVKDEAMQRWLAAHVDNPSARSNGLVTVITVEDAAAFLIDCVNHILHGMRPVTQYFDQTKAEVKFSSADMCEMFASMVDLGDEETTLDSGKKANAPIPFPSLDEV
jgi:hypothetical protein